MVTMANRKDLLDFGELVHYDALNMLLGTRLGSGTTRRVYINDLNPLQVVKIDMSPDFNNVMEWKIWHELKDTGLGKYLAPCDAISPSGDILIQRRTKPAVKFPDWMPTIFCDFKLTNYGMLDGNFVCHDYAMLILDKALEKNHLRFGRPDWWSLDVT